MRPPGRAGLLPPQGYRLGIGCIAGVVADVEPCHQRPFLRIYPSSVAYDDGTPLMGRKNGAAGIRVILETVPIIADEIETQTK